MRQRKDCKAGAEGPKDRTLPSPAAVNEHFETVEFSNPAALLLTE